MGTVAQTKYEESKIKYADKIEFARIQYDKQKLYIKGYRKPDMKKDGH